MYRNILLYRHVLIGTKTGKVLVLEEAELKSTVDVFAVVQMASAEPTALLQTSARKLERQLVSKKLFMILPSYSTRQPA